jgi:glycosyltransferase involved in cell wall biosynthesis
MKILQIGHDFDITGGVGKYLRRLVDALADAGHTVDVVQAKAPDAATWPRHVRTWTVPQVAAFDPRLRPSATRYVLDLVTELAPDVVHVHGGSNFDLDAALALRRPLVKTLHTLEFCPTGQRYHYLTRRICHHQGGWACLPRLVYKRCTRSKRPNVWWHLVRRAVAAKAAARQWPTVVVASRFVSAVAVAEGLPASRVHVIPYFTEIPPEPTPLPAHPRLLFAARLYPEKGLDLLLRAASRLAPRDVGIDVVGDGPALPAAKSLAGRLGLTSAVTFHGWQQGMDPFYRRASIIAVTSRMPEPFGIVGIEAMSHARPTVGFNVGGIGDWLQDGVNGFLVPPEDVDALAQRIAELVDAPERSRAMGLAGRALAMERFTIEAHVQRLVALYEKASRG